MTSMILEVLVPFNTSTFLADRIIMGTCKFQEPSPEELHLKKGT